MRDLRLIRYLLFGALLSASASSFAQPHPLADLEQLFQTDPARAFVEAESIFREQRANVDIDAMMATIRLTMEPARRCLYFCVVEDMFDAAIPAARDQGHWAVLAELYALRGRLLITATHYSGMDRLTIWLRAAHYADLAIEAGDRAGQVPEALGKLKHELQDYVNPEYREARIEERREQRENELEQPLVALLEAVDRASAEADDRLALAMMEEIVAEFETDPLHPQSQRIMEEVRRRLWLRGSDKLLPSLRRIADTPDEDGTLRLAMHRRLLDGCWILWSGLDDEAFRTQHWCLTRLYADPDWYERGRPRFIEKMIAFRRFAEADQLTRRYVGRLHELGLHSIHALTSLHEATPSDLRRMLVEITLPSMNFPATPSDLYWAVQRAAPPDEKHLWCYDLGMQIMEHLPEVDGPGQKANAARDAGRFFDQAGRPDLMEQANALSEQYAAEAPAVVARSALAAAQGAAREERWQDVITTLEPRLADIESVSSLVSAHILIATAYRGLQDAQDAGAWFERAHDLIMHRDLPPGERINHLVSLSSLAELPSWKLTLLDAAHQIASGAGLEILADQVADQRSAIALEEGDLPAAREALIAVIDRAEARRERLAFDPLLRQRWFADNIRPYRQLMRVAALQGDAELALACGERMRSRALMDQLAWRKTDLQVHLPPEVAQRLADLRNTRRQAYGVLTRVMGGSSPDDLRGMYMPVRGLYMPVRGPLDEDEPITDEEVARLRSLLDELGKEEAALESAIREQVPAYARAATVSIPSARTLAGEVASRPGLAVLQYTFADEGLVVTAIQGRELALCLIEEDREALYEQIGRFREAIWERSDDAYLQAEDLYQVLVQPVESVLSGADRLWIVADGIVQLVPFAALTDAENNYLGARLPIAFAPSLTLALSSRGERPVPSRDAVVVASPDTGAPELTEAADDGRGLYMPIRGMYLPIRGMYMPIRGDGEVSSALTAMAMVPLPEAKAEGEAVAGLYQNAVFLSGAEATKARLVEVGGDCAVLHIASHGYADPDFPDFSGLLFAAPGGSETSYQVLTASEVYGWSLKARLVTLSACQTALGRDVEGEGILGLSRAFIHAGAEQVVSSLWPVSDSSTRELMVAFYEALDGGASVEEALQAGQNALTASGDTVHPFYWAGFIAIRGPG